MCNVTYNVYSLFSTPPLAHSFEMGPCNIPTVKPTGVPTIKPSYNPTIVPTNIPSWFNHQLL